MFFMTRKQFEEAVNARIKEVEERLFREHEMDNLRALMYRLEDRVVRLEGNEVFKGTAVEVCNVKNT